MATKTTEISKFIENGEIESHAVVIDSADRDREKFDKPNYYRTVFGDPYLNVVSVEMLDAYIPLRKLDDETETLSFRFSVDGGNTFNVTEIEYQEFSAASLIHYFNAPAGVPGTIKLFERQVEVKRASTASNNLGSTTTSIFKFGFYSDNQFIIDASEFTNTELERYGLTKKIHTSALVNDKQIGNKHIIYSSFRFNFVPDLYINVFCDEIDTMVNRGKSNPQTMSFGRITIGGNRSNNYANQDFDNMAFPPRYFHPIAKLSALTLSFRKKNGDLYDFQGLNHVITLLIRSIVIKDHLLPQSHNAQSIAENVSKHIENTKKLQEHKKEIIAKRKKPEPKPISDSVFYGVAGLLAMGTFYASYV